VAAVPVWLTVHVKGRQVARLAHPLADESWRRHVVDLGSGAKQAEIRFTVTSRHAWAKHFCFYARSEEGRP
jgi:hypothetical protein